MKGTKNAKLMLLNSSDTKPCNGVKTAPPKIAMTNPELAIFVSLPTPEIAKP